MDGQKFDRWARTIAEASSRRGLLKGLAGALAAGLFAARAEEAAARSCRRDDPDGTRCGGCGVCSRGTCVVDPSFSCGGCLQCDPRSLTCRPNHDRCTPCETCERDGTCKNLKCKERCCNHRCVPKDACCKDADCGECGRCDRGHCENDPRKIGQKCGTSGCEVCTNHGCDNQIDNAGCFDRNGLCCDGVCCATGESCCGRTCCAGLCAGGTCCGFGSGFTAAGTELCCPFGPPCGEGDAAHCCEDGKQCCGSACCAASLACCGDGCCATGETCCGNTCCPDGKCCGATCCTGGDECCDGICKDSCDNPCGAPDLEPCRFSNDPNGFHCCPEGSPCCPGNLENRCDNLGGICCGFNTFRCGDACCDADEFQTCGGPPGGAPTHCCKAIDIACITAP